MLNRFGISPLFLLRSIHEVVFNNTDPKAWHISWILYAKCISSFIHKEKKTNMKYHERKSFVLLGKKVSDHVCTSCCQKKKYCVLALHKLNEVIIVHFLPANCLQYVEVLFSHQHTLPGYIHQYLQQQKQKQNKSIIIHLKQ